jgi:phenylpropionate dioxygenase-like ring-hydroxylating dioxygenase large terminal subunit
MLRCKGPESLDLGEELWWSPTENSTCPERFKTEIEIFPRIPQPPCCPWAALTKTADYVARDAAGGPIIAVRGEDGVVRAFRNACASAA